MSIEDVTKGMSERAGAKPAFGNSVNVLAIFCVLRSRA